MPDSPSNSGPAKAGLPTVAHRRRSDRRGATRYRFTVSVELIELESGARFLGRTSDLSRSGCYVDIINPLPNGKRVKVRVSKGNENFESLGTVRQSQVGTGMGIMFEEVAPEQEQVLQGWLAC